MGPKRNLPADRTLESQTLHPPPVESERWYRLTRTATRFGTGAQLRVSSLSKNWKKIKLLAEKLRAQVLLLRGTPLVKDLSARGEIERGDLLSSEVVFGAPFHGLMSLPERAQSALKRLDYRSDEVLEEICIYVREKTGSWNDVLVSGWLGDTRKPHLESATALKQWRYERGLTAKTR